MRDTTEQPARDRDHPRQPANARLPVVARRSGVDRRSAGAPRPRRPIRFGSGPDSRAAGRAGGRDADRVRELLLEVVRDAVDADSVESLARTVCGRLADSERYRFARIDEPAAGDDRLATRTSAGEPMGREEATVGDGPTETDGPATVRGPAWRAFRTGEPQTARGLAPSQDRGPRQGAGAGPSAREVVGIAAVPIAHDGTVFGVLVVGSTGTAIGDRERRDLAVLGEAIGFVESAIRTRRLLHAQSVSEIEIELAGGASFLCRTAAGLGCSLSLDSYVATNDGDWLLYLVVTGENAAAFPDAVADDDCVRSVKRIGDDDGEVFVGVRAETALLDTIAAIGATLTTAAMDPTGGRVAIEVPQSVDVRLLVGQVRSLYPDASLRSRTNHDRPVENPFPLSDDRRPSLTDRQREVLEACYRAGYFEWPRESTAEDVADLLGIAAPTLHAHLRKAERALLTAFLGEDGDERHGGCNAVGGPDGNVGHDTIHGP